MKKTIVKGSIALGQLGGGGAVGYLAGDHVGFERGKNVVEVIGNEHIVAGGDADGVVEMLREGGKSAEKEQYSEVRE